MLAPPNPLARPHITSSLRRVGPFLVAFTLLSAGASSVEARRAQVRAGEIDDECDVELPGTIAAIGYERAGHKRGQAVTLSLSKGARIKLVSTVEHDVEKRRVAYHVYLWSLGKRSQHFVLERPVGIRVRFNGQWRQLSLLDQPKPGQRREPPELVTELRVVR